VDCTEGGKVVENAHYFDGFITQAGFQLRHSCIGDLDLNLRQMSCMS
jgi:hypothetical protein